MVGKNSNMFIGFLLQYVKDNRIYVVKYTDEKTRRTKFINVTDLNVMVNDLKPNTLYDFCVKLVKGK